MFQNVHVVLATIGVLLLTGCLADSELRRELQRQGKEQGWGLLSVRNNRSDEFDFARFVRIGDAPHFTSYDLHGFSMSADGLMGAGDYDGLTSGPQTGPEAEAVPRRLDGMAAIDSRGRELWHKAGIVSYGPSAVSPSHNGIIFQSKTSLNLLTMPQGTVDVLRGTPGTEKAPAFGVGGMAYSTHVGAISWSPDQRYIVYDEKGKVIIYDLQAHSGRELAAGSEPSWPPDGRWIAFLSPDREGMLTDATGARMKKILAGKKLACRMPWSPDSHYVLCTELDSANIIFRLMELTDRVVVYRISDGAHLDVISSAPKGVGCAFQWMVRQH